MKTGTLVITVGITALVSITVGLRVYSYSKTNKLRKIKKKLDQEFLESRKTESKTIDIHDEALIREQLARNYAFLGEEGVSNIRKSFVIVIGLGGVGSHAAHMLIRAGVKKIRLVDFDQVTLSSLNRHAVATLSDVGLSKASALQRHFTQITPWIIIEPIVKLFDSKSASELLSGNPDYVLDCIDNIETKIDLIEYCSNNSIPIISSMGAGAKSDPTKANTSEDPLARKVRLGLRKKGVENVNVVYSIEVPNDISLLPLEEEKVDSASEYSALPTFRSRILPVLGPLPAIFGNAMATHVITELAHLSTEPFWNKDRKRTYEKLHRDLSLEEGKFIDSNSVPKLDLSVSDIAFIFEETWKGRSAISGARDKLTMIKWDLNKGLDYGNLVCMTSKEAKVHKEFKDIKGVDEYYERSMLEYINSRFEREMKMNLIRVKYIKD